MKLCDILQKEHMDFQEFCNRSGKVSPSDCQMQIILLLERNMALIDVMLQKLKKRLIIHYKR